MVGDDEGFDEVLEKILQNNTTVVTETALGLVSFKEQSTGFQDEEMKNAINSCLDRFFTARIGFRLLITQHLQTLNSGPGYRGVIKGECSCLDVAQSAAEDAQFLCQQDLGMAPEITFHGQLDSTFTYVPGHIHYMLFEVLKNACRAVVVTHSNCDEDQLPPVKVVIAKGDEDITIKVADEGGGIPRSEIENVWTYSHSTAAPPTLYENTGNYRTPLAGFGVGLPLSRLYAQYFGGNLSITSMEGFGTDVYLHLNRLGHKCENLPMMVKVSPAGGDSTLHDPIELVC